MQDNKLIQIKKIYYHIYLLFWGIFYISFFRYNIQYNKFTNINILKDGLNEYLELIKDDYLDKLTKFLQNYILANIFVRLLIPEITNSYYENLIIDIFDYSLLELGKTNQKMLKVFMIYQSFNWFLFLNILTYYQYIPKKIFFRYTSVREFKILIACFIITKTNIANYLNNYNTILNYLIFLFNIIGVGIYGKYFYEVYFKNIFKNNSLKVN
jgi:hypothetical protein